MNVRRWKAITVTVALVAGGVFVAGSGHLAAGATTPTVELEPTVVIKDGRAASSNSGRVLRQMNSTAVLFSDGVVRSGDDFAQFGTVGGYIPTLVGDKVVSLNNTYMPSVISVYDLDGGNPRRFNRPDDGAIITASPGGWLESVVAADGSSVNLRRATAAEDGSVQRTIVGQLLAAPAGRKITAATPNPEAARTSDEATAFSFSIQFASGAPYSKTVRFDFATNALTTLGEQLEGTTSYYWTVTAINQRAVTMWSPYGSTAVRRVAADNSAITWPFAGGTYMPVYDLAGMPIWAFSNGLGSAYHRGNPDGTVATVSSPWWAGKTIISVGTNVYYQDTTRGIVTTNVNGTPDTVFAGPTTDPLRIGEIDMTAGKVAWIDNSRDDGNTEQQATVWQRNMGGTTQASRKLIMDRASSGSIAQGGNSVYAFSNGINEGLNKISGSTGTLLEPFQMWNTLSVVGPSLLATYSGNMGGASTLFDLSTSRQTSLGSFQAPNTQSLAASEQWLVRMDVTQTPAPSTKIVSKKRSTGVEATVGTIPEYVNGPLRIAGQSVVWATATAVYWADLTNPTGVTHNFPLAGARIVATDGSRFAAYSPTQHVVGVYTVGGTTPDFTVESSGGFDFDSVWAVWSQDVADGNRLVAAKIPGTTGFTDITSTAPFATDITWLGTSGVTTGYSDGTYRPTGTVTREAMAAFLYRFLNPGQPDPTCTGGSRTFTDVPAGGFCGPIEWLATTGITTGFPDRTFRPSATITRQAMAAFLFRAMTPGQPDPTCTGSTRTFTDVPTGGFCGPIEWLATTGITTGFPDHTFKPGDTVTRQAMAAFMHRADAL